MLLFNKKGILFVLFITMTCLIDAQSKNYVEIFGSDWKKAQAFEKENRNWIKQILDKNKIQYSEAMAVIFPELIRYSALRDKIEITLLKALYINLGDEYANFSIGHLQMKPSFASKLREDASEYLNKRSGICFMQLYDYEYITDYRKSIVTDLENVRSEFVYLVAFLKICEKKYRTDHMNETDRIRFLSTAYNYGIDKNISQIISMSQRKYFHTKIIKPAETYSYSEISLYWYRQFTAD